jgi:hypothetical protein
LRTASKAQPKDPAMAPSRRAGGSPAIPGAEGTSGWNDSDDVTCDQSPQRRCLRIATEGRRRASQGHPRSYRGTGSDRKGSSPKWPKPSIRQMPLVALRARARLWLGNWTRRAHEWQLRSRVCGRNMAGACMSPGSLACLPLSASATYFAILFQRRTDG